jgi:hypothetical protein
MSLFRNC